MQTSTWPKATQVLDAYLGNLSIRTMLEKTKAKSCEMDCDGQGAEADEG